MTNNPASSAWRSAKSRIGLVLLGLVLGIASVAGVMAQALGPAGPSPASGVSAVIAQGVFTVPVGDQVWQVSTYTTEPDSEPITLDHPAFVLARTTPLLITDEATGNQTRVAIGEAAFLYAGSSIRLETFGPPDGFIFIELTAEDAFSIGEDVLMGQPFQPLAGTRDLDLVRTALDDGDEATLPQGAGRTLVLGLSGQVDASASGQDGVTISPGDIAEFEGEISFTGAEDGSEVVTAYIGAVVSFGDEGDATAAASPEAVETEQPTEIPATPEFQPTEAPSTPEPEPTEEPAATEAPSTPVPEPTDAPATPDEIDASPAAEPEDVPFTLIEIEGDTGADSDSDSLSDAQEEYYGTDPLLADSDNDGINDYRELVDFGTDPLNPDTDDDGVNDFNEIFIYETDPLNIDTDGDLLYDGGELLYLSDPLNPDTDDDGITDGDEVYFTLTDPTNSDTDGDGLTDGEEVDAGSDPLDPDDPTPGGQAT
jgi:hypothetical protein